MKTLLLDIETAPNKAYVWGLFNQNVALNQLEASSYVLCWSAKWLGSKDMTFRSVQRHGAPKMIRDVHALLDEADIVIHYNGLKFDIPTLNKEMVQLGMLPPAPYRQIDLMQVCKHVFRFESNKLAYVLEALSLEGKIKTSGFELWVRCMNGERKAWQEMERYNRGDVARLEVLYRRLQPWIGHHPNFSAALDVACCPKCGSREYQSRGTVLKTTLTYNRYRCNTCGGWFRGVKSLNTLARDKRMANV